MKAFETYSGAKSPERQEHGRDDADASSLFFEAVKKIVDSARSAMVDDPHRIAEACMAAWLAVSQLSPV